MRCSEGKKELNSADLRGSKAVGCKKNMIMSRFSGKYSSERFLFGDGQGSGFVAPV